MSRTHKGSWSRVKNWTRFGDEVERIFKKKQKFKRTKIKQDLI